MQPTAAPGGHPARLLWVGQLLAELRTGIAAEFPPLWVLGEIRDLHRAASGHCYFHLVDEDAQLRCACFRRDLQRIPFDLEDGLEVLAYGAVDIYPARGDLQLIARQIEPRGRGALQLALEQLRRRLEAAGLFAAERKRPLPPYPLCVGLVTSPHGAALRDVLRVASERAPSPRFLLAPTRVQGTGSEFEIVEALQSLAAVGGVDLILLVRGGGSLEDLAAFNTEIVAQAIARCPIPVVSGVGHETDWSIADLVADARAATPSQAAATALPDRTHSAATVAVLRDNARRAVATQLARQRSHLDEQRRALRRASPMARLAERRLRLRRAEDALPRVARGRLARQRERLTARQRALLRTTPRTAVERYRARGHTALGALENSLRRRIAAARGRTTRGVSLLHSLSPLAVLARGYAIARRSRDGRIVRRPDDVAPGDELSLRLHGGELPVQVKSQ